MKKLSNTRLILDKFVVSKQMQNTRNLIKEQFKTSKFIQRSQIEDELYVQDNIRFLLKSLKVDEVSKKEQSSNISKKDNFFDPFAPPFEEGYVVIDDFCDFHTHRIIFNKYPIMDNHLILVVRDFISQNTHLTLDDMKNALVLRSLMDGLIFFNGGKNSGASQARKHLQCVPFESMYNKEFGIFELVKEGNNITKVDKVESNSTESSKLCQFEFYKINKFSECCIEHILVKWPHLDENADDIILEEDETNKVELIAKLFHSVYIDTLKTLGLYTNMEKGIKNDYTLLLTDDWMLIVPRKSHIIQLKSGKLNLNSAAYTLSLLVRSEETKDELKSIDIIRDVYSQL